MNFLVVVIGRLSLVEKGPDLPPLWLDGCIHLRQYYMWFAVYAIFITLLSARITHQSVHVFHTEYAKLVCVLQLQNILSIHKPESLFILSLPAALFSYTGKY
jgi:hypothetical protein